MEEEVEEHFVDKWMFNDSFSVKERKKKRIRHNYITLTNQKTNNNSTIKNDTKIKSVGFKKTAFWNFLRYGWKVLRADEHFVLRCFSSTVHIHLQVWVKDTFRQNSRLCPKKHNAHHTDGAGFMTHDYSAFVHQCDCHSYHSYQIIE